MNLEREPKAFLNARQQRFCKEYVKDFNATRAYKKVYKCAYSTAGVEGCKSLKNPKIKAYITQLLEEREKRTNITTDKVLKELAKIGFANITDVAEVVTDSTGKKQNIIIHNTEDLAEQDLAAIAEIKEGKEGVSVKMHDKLKALDSIARHLGMYNDKLNVEADVKENNALSGLSKEEIVDLIKSLSKS